MSETRHEFRPLNSVLQVAEYLCVVSKYPSLVAQLSKSLYTRRAEIGIAF